MADSTQELLRYMRQERSNSRSLLKSVAPDKKQEAICSVTGNGHYWFVSPPPVQYHRCKHCYATKQHIPPT